MRGATETVNGDWEVSSSHREALNIDGDPFKRH